MRQADLQAVILAAGKGTRLMPLTQTRPKALMPLAGKPILLHNIERVQEAGIRDIVVVIDPHGGAVPKALGDGAALGVRLSYVVQEEQLGTAHAVKVAREQLGDGRPFLVTFCDNVTLFPLRRLVDAFRQQPVAGALALKPNPASRSSGIALVMDGRVVRVEEKPKERFSDLTMAGMYIFTAPMLRAIEHIPPSASGEYYLPDAVQWLLDRGHVITHCTFDDWRINVNRPEEMLTANHYLLANLKLPYHPAQGAGFEVVPPVYLGVNVRIGRGARVGPHASVGHGCAIGERATVEDAILFDRVAVGDDCVLRHCILGEGSGVATGVSLSSEERVAIVGDHEICK